jgi:ankyrin repeat protein
MKCPKCGKTLKDAVCECAVIKKSIELAAIDSEKISLLVGAIDSGDVPGVERILEDKIDLNVASGGEGGTPLHHAVSCGDINITRLLLLAGADPNISASDGKPPLIIAAANGNIDIVKLLHKYDAKLNARDADNLSAIDHARNKGFESIVEFIAEILAHVDDVPVRDEKFSNKAWHKAANDYDGLYKNDTVNKTRPHERNYAPIIIPVAAALVIVMIIIFYYRHYQNRAGEENTVLQITRTANVGELVNKINNYAAGENSDQKLSFIVDKILSAGSSETSLSLETAVLGGNAVPPKIAQAFFDRAAVNAYKFRSSKLLVDYCFNNFHKISEVKKIGSILLNYNSDEVNFIVTGNIIGEYGRNNYIAVKKAAGIFSGYRIYGEPSFKALVSNIESILSERDKLEKLRSENETDAQKPAEQHSGNGDIDKITGGINLLMKNNSALLAEIKNKHDAEIINYIAGLKFAPLDALFGSAGLDSADGRGNTLLMLAAAQNNFEACAKLMERKAPPNLINGDSLTVLDIANNNNNKSVIDLLRANGARTFAEIKSGEEADRGRSIVEKQNAVLELVTRNDIAGLSGTDFAAIDIDYRFDNGRTYLILATTLNHLQAVKFLIAKGAGPDIKDRDGKKAIDYAEQLHYGDIYETLKNAEKIPEK